MYDKEDNPCEQTVTLGYNTESHYSSAISVASSPLEARWNYVFWLQSQELVFGDNETSELVKRWILALDLPYYLLYEIPNAVLPDTVYDEAFEKITREFLRVLIAVVKELHATGFVESTFSKPLPLIIHELEYYDEIVEQNIEANGRPLVQGLIDFTYEG